MTKHFSTLFKRLNIKPINMNLYIEAFTHKTYANENNLKFNYQRLEFLGDAIISKIIVEFLYFHYPKYNEGKMSIIKAKYVKGPFLAQIANQLNLKSYILIGKSKDILLGNKIPEDVFESLIGAIYLDLGEQEVKKILDLWIFKDIKKHKKIDAKNPKTKLQEFLQSTSQSNIVYNTITSSNGFKSKVLHEGNLFGQGMGKTKKEAEINAAINALARMGKNEVN